jgi:formylglycine-generating enzyme required for sulfatase activity
VGASFDAGPVIKPLPVASVPSCEGGYAGLFDMVGNVAEFIDSCLPPDPGCPADLGGHQCDLCVLVGGSFQDDTSGRLARTWYDPIYRGRHYVDNASAAARIREIYEPLGVQFVRTCREA